MITLSLPLVWLWKSLDQRGREPSTTSKMAIGMFLISAAFYLMYFAGKAGGDTPSFAKLRPEIEKKLIQEESQRQQELWLASLRQKAYIRTF